MFNILVDIVDCIFECLKKRKKEKLFKQLGVSIHSELVTKSEIESVKRNIRIIEVQLVNLAEYLGCVGERMPYTDVVCYTKLSKKGVKK